MGVEADMGPDRVTFATTTPARHPGRGDGKGLAGTGDDARTEGTPSDRPLATIAALTSGLSYACRYCGRSHYPTCR
jgi:hypothetical protein